MCDTPDCLRLPVVCSPRSMCFRCALLAVRAISVETGYEPKIVKQSSILYTIELPKLAGGRVRGPALEFETAKDADFYVKTWQLTRRPNQKNHLWYGIDEANTFIDQLRGKPMQEYPAASDCLNIHYIGVPKALGDVTYTTATPPALPPWPKKVYACRLTVTLQDKDMCAWEAVANTLEVLATHGGDSDKIRLWAKDCRKIRLPNANEDIIRTELAKARPWLGTHQLTPTVITVVDMLAPQVIVFFRLLGAQTASLLPHFKRAHKKLTDDDYQMALISIKTVCEREGLLEDTISYLFVIWEKIATHVLSDVGLYTAFFNPTEKPEVGMLVVKGGPAAVSLRGTAGFVVNTRLPAACLSVNPQSPVPTIDLKFKEATPDNLEVVRYPDWASDGHWISATLAIGSDKAWNWAVQNSCSETAAMVPNAKGEYVYTNVTGKALKMQGRLELELLGPTIRDLTLYVNAIIVLFTTPPANV